MSSDPPASGRDGRRDAHAWARHAGLGVQFALTILVFTLLGAWIDGKLGSSPWFLLAGLLVAFVGGTISLVHKVPPPSRPARSARTEGDERADRSPETPGPNDSA